MSSNNGMPRALPSMWRALKRGYQAEPGLLIVAFGLSLMAAVPDGLMALWLKFLADGVLGGKRGLALAAALGLGASAAATWFLRVISDRTQRRFRDRVRLDSVGYYISYVPAIGGHERTVFPECALTGDAPGCEVSHSWQCREANIGEHLQAMDHCIEQCTKDARFCLIEAYPELALGPPLIFGDDCQGEHQRPIGEIAPADDVVDRRQDDWAHRIKQCFLIVSVESACSISAASG